ncbi:MAG TPA: hypothetical protein VFM33_01230 [Aquabacterium sp.]|nr:hypothetical protein [Aquabacterium sp.]
MKEASTSDLTDRLLIVTHRFQILTHRPNRFAIQPRGLRNLADGLPLRQLTLDPTGQFLRHSPGWSGPVWLDGMDLLARHATPANHVPTTNPGSTFGGHITPPGFPQGVPLEGALSLAKRALLRHGVIAHDDRLPG